MTSQKYPQNLHTRKIFIYLKTQKDVEIKYFTHPKMVWAYECMKISMYPPPPPTPRCDHVFFVILSFGPSVSQFIINGHFQFGKKWHMWCRLLKVHIIPSKSPLHFSEVWITWPPFCISIMCIAQRQNTEPQKRLEPETHLCWAEHYTTERLSFSTITSIVRTKQMNRLVYTEPFKPLKTVVHIESNERVFEATEQWI